MSTLAAWQVDPAWPAVPEVDDDDDDPATRPAPAHQEDLVDQERAGLARRVAELHVEGTRLLFQLHHARRALQARPPAPEQRQRARRSTGGHTGHPGNPARNDRLLALYEATPATLPRLQRCRMAARALAAEVAASAGVPAERARILPVTTARDAIAEARRRRGTPDTP